MSNEVEKLRIRLLKIGIDLELTGNYPWIYLSKIKGKVVKEKNNSEHGFVIGYSTHNGTILIKDSSKIFSLLRDYI